MNDIKKIKEVLQLIANYFKYQLGAIKYKQICDLIEQITNESAEGENNDKN